MAHTSIWSWHQDAWPQFRYDSAQLDALEASFLRQSGIFIGAVKHVTEGDREQLTVE